MFWTSSRCASVSVLEFGPLLEIAGARRCFPKDASHPFASSLALVAAVSLTSGRRCDLEERCAWPGGVMNGGSAP